MSWLLSVTNTFAVIGMITVVYMGAIAIVYWIQVSAPVSRAIVNKYDDL